MGRMWGHHCMGFGYVMAGREGEALIITYYGLIGCGFIMDLIGPLYPSKKIKSSFLEILFSNVNPIYTSLEIWNVTKQPTILFSIVGIRLPKAVKLRSLISSQNNSLIYSSSQILYTLITIYFYHHYKNKVWEIVVGVHLLMFWSKNLFYFSFQPSVFVICDWR